MSDKLTTAFANANLSHLLPPVAQEIRADAIALYKALVARLDINESPTPAEYRAAVKSWFDKVHWIWGECNNCECEFDKDGNEIRRRELAIYWKFKYRSFGFHCPADLIGPLPPQFHHHWFAIDEDNAQQVWLHVRTTGLALVKWLNDRLDEFGEAIIPTIELFGSEKDGGVVRVTLAKIIEQHPVSVGQWTFLNTLRKKGKAKFYRAGTRKENDGKFNYLLELFPSLDAIIQKMPGTDSTSRNECDFQINPVVRKRMPKPSPLSKL